MAVFSKVVKGNIEDITEFIDEKIMDKGISTECAAKILNFENELKTALLVYNKYFLRTGSIGTLTIMLAQENKDSIKIDAVSTGGKNGIIIEHSYGADEKFLEIAESIINNL